MSKNTDNKDLGAGNDKSSGKDTTGSLIKDTAIKETQIQRTSDDHAGSLDSFGHSFNKLVATVTGQKIDSVADQLSPNMAERLYHGKILDQQLRDYPHKNLSVDERQSLDDYTKFKDKITRQIPLFDHDALIETLNARIAERVSQNKPAADSTTPNNKRVNAAVNEVKAPSTEQKSQSSQNSQNSQKNVVLEAPSRKVQPIQKEKGKVEDVSTSAEKRRMPEPVQPEKNNAVSSASPSVHLAKQSEIKLTDAARSVQERNLSPMTKSAELPFDNRQKLNRTEESRLASAQQSDKKVILAREQPVDSLKRQHNHVESLVPVANFSKKGPNLSLGDLREIFKGHTVLKPKTQSNSIEFHQLNTLSERTLKSLNHCEMSLQRSFSIQKEKLPDNDLAKNFSKSSSVTAKQDAHALVDSYIRNTGVEPKTTTSRLMLPEPGVIKYRLTENDSKELGSSPKTMPGAKTESHASAATDVQHPMPSKNVSEIPRVTNFTIAEKNSTPARAIERVEFLSNLSIKADAQRRLVLPVSNLLARTPQVDRSTRSDVSPRRELGPISGAKRMPPVDRPDKRITTNEKSPQPQTKEFVVVRGQIGQRRYVLGTEIALAAIIASAGIARIRQDKVIAQDFGSQNTPRINPALETDLSANRPEPIAFAILEKSRCTIKPETVGRRIDEDIEDFAVPSELLLEVKSNGKQFLRHLHTFSKQILGINSAREISKTQPLLRPTILVEVDDTLQKIAERYFNDINIAWLIADLNRGNVQESYIDSRRIISMRSRQTLILPVWADIVDFYQNDLTEVEIARLVTVVETSQVDVELYSKTFANVIENKKT
jgi:hypothetical protein